MIDEPANPTSSEAQSAVGTTAADAAPEQPPADKPAAAPQEAASPETASPEAASPEAAAPAPAADASPGAGSTKEGAPAEGATPAEAAEAAPPPKAKPKRKSRKKAALPEVDKDWYILKVQSNRETTIADALRRRVTVEGLDHYFGEVIVPTEMVTEFKGGKKRVVRRKLYPGYIVVHMHINDDTWFLVRETPGIGDFTGAGGKPTPMQPHEVQRIVLKQEEKTDDAPKLKINFNTGDRVKINEGTFENFEGEVSAIDEASGRVTVMINIFGRSTPVELEYWQVETV